MNAPSGRFVLEHHATGWTVGDLADPDRTLPATRAAIPAGVMPRDDAQALLDRLERRHQQHRAPPAGRQGQLFTGQEG